MMRIRGNFISGLPLSQEVCLSLSQIISLSLPNTRGIRSLTTDFHSKEGTRTQRTRLVDG